METIIENISKLKTKNQVKSILWKAFIGKKCGKNCGSELKIALLNAPCYGFGDVIFAQKLYKYLKQWYGATVHIFTTLPKSHLQLGMNPDDLIQTSVKESKTQCRRFAHLPFEKGTNAKYDLYFVAPIVANFSPEYRDIAKMFKYANKFNTFFFSEYNASYPADYDFPTGVGGIRDGLLLVKPPPMKKPSIMKNPYALIYIASDEHIPRARPCYMSFIEMVAKKYYRKYKNFDIIVPEWIASDILNQIVDRILKYYPKIIVKTKKDEIHLSSIGTKTLTIRGDVLPVDNLKMMALMKYSVQDILLTGDQSITDALSCCPSKNIFYQIAPWKEGFGRELAKELPNKYLMRKKTSCGDLHAIRYKSNYHDFIEKWDFRKKGKVKLDAIILFTMALNKDPKIRKILEILKHSKTVKSIKSKIL